MASDQLGRNNPCQSRSSKQLSEGMQRSFIYASINVHAVSHGCCWRFRIRLYRCRGSPNGKRRTAWFETCKRHPRDTSAKGTDCSGAPRNLSPTGLEERHLRLRIVKRTDGPRLQTGAVTHTWRRVGQRHRQRHTGESHRPGRLRRGQFIPRADHVRTAVRNAQRHVRSGI